MASASHHIIVGGGQSGANAAFALRHAGFQGAITLVGAERYLPYERPPLSKEALTKPEFDEPPLFFLRSRYDEHGITLQLGRTAVAIDASRRRLELDDGASLAYDRLLLATGGRPRPLGVPGAESVVQLRDVDDARRLRTRLRKAGHVVCIGAGPIGLEVASAARAMGCEVTVVQRSNTIMGRCLPAEIAAWLCRRHESQGIRVVTNFSLAAIEAGHLVERSGDGLAADLVVAGTGMVPNVELAMSSGVRLDPRVVVNAYGETSVSGVFAAGDVTTFWRPSQGRYSSWETWRHAMNHGVAVGKAMAGQCEPYADLPYFWTDQAGVRIQVIGDAAGPLKVSRLQDDSRFSLWYLDANHRVAGVVAVDAARDIKIAERLIQTGRSVDPRLVSDPAFPLQNLLR